MADGERLLAGQTRATGTRFRTRPLTASNNVWACKERWSTRQTHTLEGATCGEGERVVVSAWLGAGKGCCCRRWLLMFGGSLQR
jgi:hypothetical protein